MTSRGSAAHNGHDRRSGAIDLSAVFGAAAAALSRPRIRARRPRPAREPDPVETEILEDDVPETTTSRDAPADPTPRRRFGVVKVRDRQHVGLLLLAAATKGPANGYELTALVRERSDGLFVLSLRTVIHELHRLVNNRLMQVTGGEGARRYSLTPLGERVLATRRREWEAFSRGLDSVLDAGPAQR
jgi:DNA-binding PadR family transcriptional regulator